MEKKTRVVSWEELRGKNTKQECWICVDNVVWNVTDLLPKHPGGSFSILQLAGAQDCSAEFKAHHPSPTFLETMLGAECKVGHISSPVKKPQPESHCYSLDEFERVATAKLGKNAFAYFSTGSESELTLEANLFQFRHRAWLVPRTLIPCFTLLDLSLHVFGVDFKFPFLFSATAMQQLADPVQRELAGFHACKNKGIPYMVPHLSSVNWSLFSDPDFLQLYLPLNVNKVDELLLHAKSCQFKAIFVTVDSAHVGKRERELNLGGSLAPRSKSQRQWKEIITFDDIRYVVERSSLPIVLKGIQRAEDALQAVKLGVQGIYVSNHGGRNLDGARPTLASLVEIHEALCQAGCRHKVVLFVDGGVRRGTDVMKALCLGANMVGLGRSFLYALAVNGQRGVEDAIDVLGDELEGGMKLMGCRTLSELQRNLVEYPRAYL